MNCTGTYSSSTSAISLTCTNGTSTPLYIQDSGNVSFALSIVIAILFIMMIGFMFNHLNSKKPWM